MLTRGFFIMVGLLLGLSYNVLVAKVDADDNACSVKMSRASDGCVPIKELMKYPDCKIPQDVKCFFVPITIVDDKGHEVDDERGGSKCKHDLKPLEVKLNGIDQKDDKTILSWIEFLKGHLEIKEVNINVYGPNYSIAETKKRINLILERMKEVGIETSRLKPGRHIKAKDSYIQIDILKIGEKDG